MALLARHGGIRTRNGSRDRHSSFSGLSAIGVVVIVALTGLSFLIGTSLTGLVANPDARDISTPDGMFALLKQGSEIVNAYQDKVPKTLVTIFGNERIQGEVSLSSGKTLVVGAVTKNGRVVSFTKGQLEKPSLKVYTNEGVVRKVLASPIPVDAINSALKEKSIRYEAQSFTGSVKFGIASRLMSWFAPKPSK